MANDAARLSCPCQDAISAILGVHLKCVGLDILHAFPVQLFNSHSPVQHQLPTFDRSSTLAVVIGNSNSLWQPFVAAMAHSDSQLCNEDNPLDAYVEEHVTKAVQAVAQSFCSQSPSQQQQQLLAEQSESSSPQQTFSTMLYEVRFSHDTEPNRFINMLRAAELSGLAYYSPTTHLCLHPTYGPWFALRAVVVFDCDGPDPAGFTPLACPHPALEAAAADAMKQLEAKGGLANWQAHWREWAELRSIGGRCTDLRFCYSEDQLEYHYTKSKDILARAVNKFLQQQQDSAQQQDLDQQQQQQR